MRVCVQDCQKRRAGRPQRVCQHRNRRPSCPTGAALARRRGQVDSCRRRLCQELESRHERPGAASCHHRARRTKRHMTAAIAAGSVFGLASLGQRLTGPAWTGEEDMQGGPQMCS